MSRTPPQSCPSGTRIRKVKARESGAGGRGNTRKSTTLAEATIHLMVTSASGELIAPMSLPAIVATPLRRLPQPYRRHTETQTLHHRHAASLFATHYFTDAAWCDEQRDEVRSRETC